jgi:hypothetical protein
MRCAYTHTKSKHNDVSTSRNMQIRENTMSACTQTSKDFKLESCRPDKTQGKPSRERRLHRNRRRKIKTKVTEPKALQIGKRKKQVLTQTKAD